MPNIYMKGGINVDYSSNSKGNLGVTLGAIGTGLGAIGTGVLGNIFGGMGTQQNYVTKDMMELQLQLAASQKDNSILTAELSSEKKMVEVFNAANDRINNVRDELGMRIREVEAKVDANAAAQAVINCQANSNLTLLNSQVGQLFGLCQLKIPNTSVCPGWGGVTVMPTPTTLGTTTA